MKPACLEHLTERVEGLGPTSGVGKGQIIAGRGRKCGFYPKWHKK